MVELIFGYANMLFLLGINGYKDAFVVTEKCRG
jgi:hypothetical protein